MSADESEKSEPTARRRRGPASDSSVGSSVRGISSFILLAVNVFVAVQMVVSVVSFGLNPDPDVEAGAMWFTLTFTTAAALLMLVMALNATYLPFVTRKQAPNVYLVLIALGLTGVIVGLLTVGDAATPLATRLLLGAIALTFLTMQRSRHLRAQDAIREGRSPTPQSTSRAQPQRVKSRQRRGGRKR